jgi:hypothetical protein
MEYNDVQMKMRGGTATGSEFSLVREKGMIGERGS